MQNDTKTPKLIFFGQFTEDRVSHDAFYHSCIVYKGSISLIYTILIKVRINA